MPQLSAGYAPLPTDAEDPQYPPYTDDSSRQPSGRRIHNSLRKGFPINDLYLHGSPILETLSTIAKHRVFRRLITILAIFLGSVASYGMYKFWRLKMGIDNFVFDGIPRPAYLDVPLDRPLVIRLGIISRVDGFEKRQALREAMLAGVPPSYVQLDFKFFVGAVPNTTAGVVIEEKIKEENRIHGDMMVLNDIADVPLRISEKRFAAIRWTASVPKEEYDYSMTLDSDSFCRLRTLAQRLTHVYKNLKPREEPILIGNMGVHDAYWENTTPDGSKDDSAEDTWFTGPSFPYPMGIGYMLSSNLVATILTADPPLPHHIDYPYDDVMVGSWMAALKSFHNSSLPFQSPRGKRYVPSHRVYPKPYLPYVVDARLIDDKPGWHDFWHRGALERSVTWDTACVHRIKPVEMMTFRQMKEIKDEWDVEVKL